MKVMMRNIIRNETFLFAVGIGISFPLYIEVEIQMYENLIRYGRNQIRKRHGNTESRRGLNRRKYRLEVVEIFVREPGKIDSASV